MAVLGSEPTEQLISSTQEHSVNIPTRSIVSYLCIAGSIVVFLVVAGAFWESEHNPFQEDVQVQFPAGSSVQLSRSIEDIFTQPGIVKSYTRTPMESASDGSNIAWTQYEYTARLEQKSRLPHVIRHISAAIETSGGQVFQTYVEAENHQALVVVGIGSFITHHLVFTWPAPPVLVQATPTPLPEAPEKEAPSGFRAAIIIDDLGSSPFFVQSLLALDADLTYSILPHLEKSTEIAGLLHERRQEILLHLPMEPQNYPAISPGKGAILSRTTHEQIQQIIDRDLQTVPFASGVNNHMGSRLTADRGQMEAVLKHLRTRQLFFVDSRTSGATVGYPLAKQLGLKSAQRKIFLDVVPEVQAVKIQLQKLASLAEQGETAIAIGHPKSATLQALQEMLPEFKARNIEIVRVSEFTR